MRHFPRMAFILACLTLFITSGYAAPPTDVQKTELIRLTLTPNEAKQLRGMDIDFATGLEDSVALAVVSKAELAVLSERGYRSEPIMTSDKEVDLYKRALYGPDMTLPDVYHTAKEIVRELKELKANYPQMVKLKKIGQTSQEKHDIWAVKISDNAPTEEDEPAILFSGSIHADELAGTEICMTLINELLNSYGTDSLRTAWVDAYEIWFIPIINVDGHTVVTSSIDPRWRKNTRDNNGNGVLLEKGDGIDLNRNFDFNWAHGGSGDPENGRYRGKYPFSEREDRAVADLALEQKFVLSITYHSQGEVIYYPWDWRGRKAPDDALLTKLANELGSSIRTMKGDTTYIPHYGAALVGQTYPWLYGVAGTLDFIVETGKNRHVFPPSSLKKIIAGNLPGAYYMLNQMNGPGLTGHVTDATTGDPLVAEVYFPDIDTEDIERRTTEKRYGRYHRRLESGTYRVIFRKPGYETRVMTDITVRDTGWTDLEVALTPLSD